MTGAVTLFSIVESSMVTKWYALLVYASARRHTQCLT
jgi:hypothetical protein